MALELRMIGTREYGELHGLSQVRVRKLCEAGRIPGAKKIGKTWIIPADALPVPAQKGPKGRWERTNNGDVDSE